MPCNSGYLEPREEEINLKLTSELIIFVNSKLGIKTPKNIIDSSRHVYGEGGDLNKNVVYLCKTLGQLTPQQSDAIIYNGKDKMARKLADWWDEHQEADRERIKEEAKLAKREALKKSAMAKLSKAEIDALLD
jgi:hypothetical protein